MFEPADVPFQDYTNEMNETTIQIHVVHLYIKMVGGFQKTKDQHNIFGNCRNTVGCKSIYRMDFIRFIKLLYGQLYILQLEYGNINTNDVKILILE